MSFFLVSSLISCFLFPIPSLLLSSLVFFIIHYLWHSFFIPLFLPTFYLLSFLSLFFFLPLPLLHALLSSLISLFLPLSWSSIHFSFLYIFILFLYLFTTYVPYLLLFPLHFSSFFCPLSFLLSSLSDWFYHSEWRLSGTQSFQHNFPR